MANGIFFTKEVLAWKLEAFKSTPTRWPRHLTELGEKITLLHYVPEGYRGDDEFDRTCGYPVVRFSTKVGTGRWYKDIPARTLLFATLVKEARRIGAEYIIYNGFDGSPLFIASLFFANRILGIPAYLFIHYSGGFPESRSRLHRFATSTMLRSAAGVITVSRWAVPFLDKFKVKPERLHVIHNGVDLREADFYQRVRNPDRFARLDDALPIGGPNILCVARLHTNKRIDRLILAMPRILEEVPDAKLAIAGIGNEEGNLRRMMSDSPAKHSITFLGLVTGEEKFECYARCSVFALPSDFESFGLVLIEAGAFGKPVVATQIGGVPEAIQHSKNGLLVAPDDDRALADAIVGLLTNPVVTRRMGEHGRRRVENLFTWSHSADKLRAIVHQAIK